MSVLNCTLTAGVLALSLAAALGEPVDDLPLVAIARCVSVPAGARAFSRRGNVVDVALALTRADVEEGTALPEPMRR